MNGGGGQSITLSNDRIRIHSCRWFGCTILVNEPFGGNVAKRLETQTVVQAQCSRHKWQANVIGIYK